MSESDEVLLRTWRAIHEASVTGWDLSDLGGGFVEQQPPWSYADLARDVLAGAVSALDLGTGGGEALLEMRDALPSDTVATEGWPRTSRWLRGTCPPTAYLWWSTTQKRRRLCRSRTDVSTSCWTGMRPTSRRRSSGCCDPEDASSPSRWTGAISGRPSRSSAEPPAIPTSLWRISGLKRLAAGFAVQAAEGMAGVERSSGCHDPGALLRARPWEVPEDFSVDRYAAQLLDLHHSRRDLTFTQRRFYLQLTRPG